MAKKKSKINVSGSIAIAGAVVVALFVGLELLGINLVSGLQNIEEQEIDEPLTIPFLPDQDPNEIAEDVIDDLPSVIDNPEMDVDTRDPDGFPEEEDPITSNDPPEQQYEDEINSEPVTITFNTVTTLTDSQGNRTESITNLDIPLLSFFVQDISNIDFTNGFIETKLEVITSDPSQINGNATLTILIGNQTIGEPINLDVDITTDEQGVAVIDFLSSTGIGSDVFLFQFNDHLDKFPTQGLTKVQYVLDIEMETNQHRYEQDGLVIYSIDIATDPNQIIIMNEEGGLERVYPTDDVLTIRNGGATSKKTSCTGSTGGRCNRYTTFCTGSAIGTAGTITILDSNNQPILLNEPLTTRESNNAWSSRTACSGSTDQIMIQRNESYTIQFTSQVSGLPSTTFTLQTPESQKNYAFTCSWAWGNPIPSCNFPMTGETIG